MCETGLQAEMHFASTPYVHICKGEVTRSLSIKANYQSMLTVQGCIWQGWGFMCVKLNGNKFP